MYSNCGIERHEFTQTGPNEYICNHCQRIIKTRSGIRVHIRNFHRDVTNMYQCPYCPQKSNTKSVIYKHIIIKHTNEKDIKCFECHTCGKKFKRKPLLREHMVSHSNPTQQCTICSKLYKTINSLKKHIKYVHNKEPYKRNKRLQDAKKHIEDEVHNVFNKAENLKRGEQSGDVSKNADKTHKRKKDYDDTSKINWAVAYRTNKVDYGPLIMEKLKEIITITAPATVAVMEPHEFTKSGPNEYICNHCQRIIKSRSGIRKHIRNLHRDITNMYQCPYCLQKNKMKARIKWHIILKHTNYEKDINNLFECHTCGKRFKWRRLLREHILTHSSRAQQCTMCSMSFKTGNGLRTHIKYVHNKESYKINKTLWTVKKHIEGENHNGFNEAENLETGDRNDTKEINWANAYRMGKYRDDPLVLEKLRKVTMIAAAPATAAVIEPHKFTKLGPNEYICNRCRCITKTRGGITRHIKNFHPDVTNMYQCPSCPQKGITKRDIYRHIILKHTNEKDINWFECYTCGKKFTQKQLLREHIVTHSSRAQQCTMCSKSFKTGSGLRAHIKHVHKKPYKRLPAAKKHIEAL